MKNSTLVKDYYTRAGIRLEALKVLFSHAGYADVVRESQEIVELVAKACVRFLGADPARVHDVSTQLESLKDRVSAETSSDIDLLIEISKYLRRDRELAFYGSEDLTPSEFYSIKDAEKAIFQANQAYQIVGKLIL